LRIVIDTNVLISAIFWPGKPKQLLNAVRRGEIIFISSESLLEELKGVLISLVKPFRLGEAEADLIIGHLKEISNVVHPKREIHVCRDEADNRVLECVLDGQADFIITGDKDLLELGIFEGIKIAKLSDLVLNLG